MSACDSNILTVAQLSALIEPTVCMCSGGYPAHDVLVRVCPCSTTKMCSCKFASINHSPCWKLSESPVF